MAAKRILFTPFVLPMPPPRMPIYEKRQPFDLLAGIEFLFLRGEARSIHATATEALANFKRHATHFSSSLFHIYY